MWRNVIAAMLLIALGGCAKTIEQLVPPRSPPLSMVGQGLTVTRAPLPAAFVEPDVRSPNSLWSYNNGGLFHDLRARKVGDVVTVTIDINDKAQFDNQSDRSKERGIEGTLAAALSFGGFGIAAQSGDAAGNVNTNGSASSRGAGSIDRSEKLRLSIAAVVTEVLRDGNLLISGSQEIRVNNELRVLNIAGIVRSLDISSDNMVSYDKMAEARVSYGGRGLISDVQ